MLAWMLFVQAAAAALLVATAHHPRKVAAAPAKAEHAIVDPATTETEPATAAAEPDETASDDDADGDGDESEAEADAPADEEQGPPGVRYSRDLDDDTLKERFKGDLASLGSISVGFADQGRLINGVHLSGRPDAGWVCVRPDLAWGTQETVDGLVAAFSAVHEQFPDSAPARLNHIGLKDGGWLRPHRSHQSGRDADIGLFYKGDRIAFGRGKRDKLIDPARNFALLKALMVESDVQVILVDRGIQNVLRTWALNNGEDPLFVRALFQGGDGRKPIVQHAKKHRDHFHVRFFAPRSQELGRRIQPLLAERPDQNIAVHKVKRGQTVGHIARIYKTTVAAVLKANHLRRPALHVGQRLLVPMRKACTRCPLPPPVIVPQRILPADVLAARARPADPAPAVEPTVVGAPAATASEAAAEP